VSRWRVVPGDAEIVERETDYTASFDAHNADTGAVVKVEFTQGKGGPVTDIINALRATAALLQAAALGETDPKIASTEKLN
jgi:hypothetical protein